MSGKRGRVRPLLRAVLLCLLAPIVAIATIPLGRVAKPEEIAAPILFLCTFQAGFITGEVFNVNGGAVLMG